MSRILYLCVSIAMAFGSDVLELTDSNFADTLAGHDIALVKFYAPWCGHCKKLAPEFDKAAAVLQSNDPPVALVKVDCTEAGKETCSKYGVSGYPTLKIFKNGEQTDDYNGPREADGIVKHMRSKAGPTSKVLSSVADVEKFISADEVAIVGFFTSEDELVYKQFKKSADALSDLFRFGHSLDKKVLEKYGYKNDVVLFRPKRLENKFEPSALKFDGDNIKEWINDNVQGLCGHITSSNAAQFKKPLVVAYYDVDYVKNAKGTNYWRNRIMKVAKQLKDAGKTMHFAIGNKDDFNHEITEFGLTATGDKPVVGAKDEASQKFPMKMDFSIENFEKFVNDFLDGTLKPYLKSEPIPKDNNDPVKTVVAENFNDIVNDETKDVLIEFYAPWCGHCKSLAPKYDELATKLKNEESIVIAKMDATANDVPANYQVQGFPTIYYAPKGNKKNPKKYEGGREVDEFIKYLAKEASSPLKGYDKSGKKIKAKKTKEEL